MKSMRIAILIMSTNKEPSITNEKGMYETFIKYTQDNSDSLNHHYDFYFYYADQSKFTGDYQKDLTYTQIVQSNVYNVYCNVQESIYRTFEKTIFTFNAMKGYDWYIRINISNFINIKLLDLVINEMDKSFIYCNAINTIVSDENYLNDIYPRGDFYMMSDIVRTAILPEANKLLFSDVSLDFKKRCNVIHVDDCLLGVVLVKTFGNTYQDMLKMLKYNFIPRNNIENFDKFAISSRVKTIPPNENYSGYSWEDNEYRRQDYKKMKLLYDTMLLLKYNNVQLNNLLVDESVGRPTIFVQYLNAHLPQVKHFLKSKKRG